MIPKYFGTALNVQTGIFLTNYTLMANRYHAIYVVGAIFQAEVAVG